MSIEFSSDGANKCFSNRPETLSFRKLDGKTTWFPAVWLSFYTTNQDLKRWFSPFGLVTEARLVMDNKTQRPKGFGFVSFQSEFEAQNALKAMNGRVMHGRIIFVEVAETTRPGEDANTAIKPVEDKAIQK